MDESKDPKEKFCKWEKKEIHNNYRMAILGVIIIVLITWKFGDDKALTEMINFAVGLTSVALAVIAIVYAFLSNNAFAGTASKIDSAASSIKKETENLHLSLKKVEDVVNAIPQTLVKIEEGIDKTNKFLESKPEQELSPQAASNDDNVKAYAAGVIDRFMTATSWNGLKVLCLCHLAWKANVSFNLRDWTATDSTVSFDYAYGYLVASASAGFVYVSDDNGTVKIHSLPTMVSERVFGELNNRLGREVVATDWNNQFQLIQKFVNEQSRKQQGGK